MFEKEINLKSETEIDADEDTGFTTVARTFNAGKMGDGVQYNKNAREMIITGCKAASPSYQYLREIYLGRKKKRTLAQSFYKKNFAQPVGSTNNLS
jgi:hypothetical protein